MTPLIKIIFGSHLYGTSTPQSDHDYKTVFLPSARDIVLHRVVDNVSNRRKKQAHEKNSSDDIDHEAFALHRYLALLAQGQTLALDMLFAPDWAMIGEIAPIWKELVANRHRLITRQSAKFVSYCVEQAKKYGIRGSHVHAVRNLLQWFDQVIEEHGQNARLLTAIPSVKPFIAERRMEFTDVIKMHQKGIDREYLECCTVKMPFTARLKDARIVYQRMMDTYGARSLMAESNQNVDWKSMSHAVRIAHEAIEFLNTGWITFPRPDATHLLAVKLGQVPYVDVANEIEGLLDQVTACQVTSTLPDQADIAYIDDLVFRAYGKVVADAYRTKV